MILILIVILLVWALGVIPVYPYSRNWGYTGVSIPVILLILLILMLFSGLIRW